MIKGFYDKYMYTPMPEMHNEMIPVTDGCSYGKCIYCDLNMGKKFRVFDLKDIKKYIRKRAKFYEGKRFTPNKFTLLEGNPLCLKTEFLTEVLIEIKENFPKMKYVSCFGLNRLCLGIESGDDEVLKFHNKGVTTEEQLKAIRMLEEVGIDYSCYIMLGLGGKEHSREHILNTAKFLNKTNPFEIVVVNLVIFSGAELVNYVKSGEFKRISLKEQIEEEILLLEHLNIHTIYNGTHKTKILPLTTKIPERKDDLLKLLREEDKKTNRELLKEEKKKWGIWDKE